jgi:hypothetical protein
MIYSGEEDVPFLMLLRRNRSATGKCFIQQFKARHAQNGKLTPVRKTTAAAFACNLICEEVRCPFLNAIVLRLHDSLFTVICKTQQAFLMDGRQNKLMNGRIYAGGRRVPYYMKRAPHSIIIKLISGCEDGELRLSGIYKPSSS